MKHIELDEANEGTKKMQGMQAYHYISSRRCHQYKWLGCLALSKSSTPDLSEKTSLIDSPSTSTKQPASSCLPPDSTMPGAPTSMATTATAVAAAAIPWKPLVTTAAAPSLGATLTPPAIWPGRPLARAPRGSITPGTHTPTEAVAVPCGRCQHTRLAAAVIGKRSFKFQPKKDLIIYRNGRAPSSYHIIYAYRYNKSCSP